jgi:hypothetical protein
MKYEGWTKSGTAENLGISTAWCVSEDTGFGINLQVNYATTIYDVKQDISDDNQILKKPFSECICILAVR